jgi:hypothetical protein
MFNLNNLKHVVNLYEMLRTIIRLVSAAYSREHEPLSDHKPERRMFTNPSG